MPNASRVQTNDGVHEATSWPAAGVDELSQHWWVGCRSPALSASTLEVVHFRRLPWLKYSAFVAWQHSACLPAAAAEQRHPLPSAPALQRMACSPRWPPCQSPQPACSGWELLPAVEAASSGILTTSGGTIVDPSGNEVVLKGYALSGMEIGHTISGDPTEGTNSINKDWLTNMYRWAMPLCGGPLAPVSRLACCCRIRASSFAHASGNAPPAQSGQYLPQSQAPWSVLQRHWAVLACTQRLSQHLTVPEQVVKPAWLQPPSNLPDGVLGLHDLTVCNGTQLRVRPALCGQSPSCLAVQGEDDGF